MRLAFNIAIFAGAIFYALYAFTELELLTANGRLGPGFFPRVIGVLLIVTILYSMFVDLRSAAVKDEKSTKLRDVLVFAALTFLFVALMQVLGGALSMVVYMLLALAIFNPGKHLKNVLVSLLLPAAIYLMFHVWLRASLPEGIFPFLG